MADNEHFTAITQMLMRYTSLNDLQARGLLRRLLKEAGLAGDEVTPQQLTAVARTLLGPALLKQGVSDVDSVRERWLEACTRQEDRARTQRLTNVENTVEEVFARMGLRR